MHSIRYQVTTWFICEWLLCNAFYNLLLLLNVTKNSVDVGYNVFLLKVWCQKRKPQIDGFFLRTLHILCQEKYLSWKCRLLQTTTVRGYHAVNKKPCYYMVLLWVVTMNLRILLQATAVKFTKYSYYKWWPRTEATNWQLVSGWSAHTRSEYTLLKSKNGSHKLTATLYDYTSSDKS